MMKSMKRMVLTGAGVTVMMSLAAARAMVLPPGQVAPSDPPPANPNPPSDPNPPANTNEGGGSNAGDAGNSVKENLPFLSPSTCPTPVVDGHF